MQVKSIAKWEHIAILSTFIKLPFVIKTFLLSILSGRFTQVLLYKRSVKSYIINSQSIACSTYIVYYVFIAELNELNTFWAEWIVTLMTENCITFMSTQLSV